MEKTILNKKRDIPIVHVIRGLTSFLIMFFHFSNYSDWRGNLFTQNSWIVNVTNNFFEAVTVFFFISGFILPWAMYSSDYKIFNYPRYFLKRIIRIHPPYVVSILLAIFIILGFQFSENLPLHIDVKRFIAHFFYAIPFTKIEWYNVIYWTLAVEIQFYIIIGFLFPLLNSESYLLKYIPIIAILIGGYFFPYHDFVTGYSIPFCTGMLFFQYYKNGSALKYIELFICIGLIAYQYFFFSYPLERTFFMVVALTMLLLKWPVNYWLNWLGETSYSLYLTHGFFGGWFIYNLKYRIDGFNWSVLLLVDALIISLIGARIFYLLVENPSKKWAAKIRYSKSNS